MNSYFYEKKRCILLYNDDFENTYFSYLKTIRCQKPRKYRKIKQSKKLR